MKINVKAAYEPIRPQDQGLVLVSVKRRRATDPEDRPYLFVDVTFEDLDYYPNSPYQKRPTYNGWDLLTDNAFKLNYLLRNWPKDKIMELEKEIRSI